MSEEEELVAQIAAQIEVFMGEYGFTQLRRPDSKVLILYCPLDPKTRDVIHSHGTQRDVERGLGILRALGS